jgi:N-acetylglucosaminyldiphosphoundecaprenol N-acetyl-beta-D-mannosaminyltransferase
MTNNPKITSDSFFSNPQRPRSLQIPDSNRLLSHKRVDILGVQISAVNMEQAVETIHEWIAQRESHYVCVTSFHGPIECHKNPELLSIFNGSGMATPDGMSIVWLLKLNGMKHVSRVYGPDLMLEVCRQSVQFGWRHFFYGGLPGIPEKLTECLSAKYPGINIAGSYSPPFRPLTSAEDREVVELINSLQPDIVWVGISTPKQERWMAEHLGRISAPVMIGVGAAFDFLSGSKKQAPRWMQRSGLEWLFRLASEPRRLFSRYAQFPYYILLALAQRLGLKDYPIR